MISDVNRSYKLLVPTNISLKYIVCLCQSSLKSPVMNIHFLQVLWFPPPIKLAVTI